jgi:hypothetical protein
MTPTAEVGWHDQVTNAAVCAWFAVTPGTESKYENPARGVATLATPHNVKSLGHVVEWLRNGLPIRRRPGLAKISEQASWTKPRKLWAWYSQRMRIRRCH